MTEPACKPPSAYLHGGDSPVVIVPARVARILVRRFALDRYHVANRGRDPELDSVLVALKTAGVRWRASFVGSSDAPDEEVLPASVLTTRQAAQLLGMTSRAVRFALAEGRLEGRLLDSRRWEVSRESVEHYRAAALQRAA